MASWTREWSPCGRGRSSSIARSTDWAARARAAASCELGGEGDPSTGSSVLYMRNRGEYGCSPDHNEFAFNVKLASAPKPGKISRHCCREREARKIASRAEGA